MKKIFAIMLALVLVLAMAAPAMAATITVPTDDDKNNTPETYTAYKIFEVTKNGSAYAYKISASSPWVAALQDTKQTWVTLTLAANGTEYIVAAKTDFTTPAAANAFAEYLLANKLASVTGTSLTAGDNMVEDGYYLITSTRGSALALATTDIPVSITEKNSYPSVTKEADKEDASFGETITYTVTVTIPKTVNGTIMVTDTLENGLTFVAYDESNSKDIVVSRSGNEITWTIETSDWTVAAGSETTTVELKYTAYINTTSGEISTDVNSNTVYITYSNFQSTDVTVNVVSYKASFIKVDGTTGDPLTGVTFKLTDEGGNEIEVVGQASTYRVADPATKAAEGYAKATITSGTDGAFTIEGLASGTYKLVELTTLSGYNLLPTPVTFTINDANNEYHVNQGENDDVSDNNVIENNTGSSLPSTGGIGTTIFYVVGGLLMAAAVVLLVTKKKVASSK